MAEGLLIKQEKYLETGIHIGTKLRTIDMAKFIYRTRNDGLYVLDLRAIDERIRLVGKVLSKFEPEDIVIIASRTYSSISARVFAKLTGAKVISGRFVPGAFTNVARKDFVEPKLVFICDPKGERQAVVECGKMGITTVGLCDTDNFTMFIDWAIPCNNKGRRALALIFWLLAREIAMGKGKISTYDEFEMEFEAFETMANQIAEDDANLKKLSKGKQVSPKAEDAEEKESDETKEEESKDEKKSDKKPAKAKVKTVKKESKAHKKEEKKDESKKKEEKKPEAKKEEPKTQEKKEVKEEKKAEAKEEKKPEPKKDDSKGKNKE